MHRPRCNLSCDHYMHTTCVNITVSPVLSLKRVIDLRVSYMYRRRAVRERSQSFFAM